jgi:signal transduction histidine kinase
MAACRDTRQAKLLDLKSKHLPKGSWSEPPQQAYPAPVILPGGQSARVFVVAGVSPHKRLDPSYRSFFELLVAQVGSTIAETLAYEAERKRAEALAEIDRAKTLFFSNISHEFCTPLTLMLGPPEETLRRPSIAGEDRQQLTVMHRNGLRLLKLVNALVVLNLLSNAFKFTIEGTIAISVHADLERSAAVLTVRDTGIGIPENELPHIFERFHRVENARGRTHEGTGIGLALVQELVRLHGGIVEVESSPGRGRAFAVHLPFGESHLPAARIGAGKTQASTATHADAFVEEADGGGKSPAAGDCAGAGGREPTLGAARRG